MRAANWNDDDDLVRDIGQALLDERIRSDARDALTRSAGAGRALATLNYDSYVDGGASVRGPNESAHRTLRFEGADRSVEIEISDGGVEGQLIPPEPGSVTMFTADGPCASVTADDVGCFHLPVPPRGPMRLECTVTAGTFQTEWHLLGEGRTSFNG